MNKDFDDEIFMADNLKLFKKIKGRRAARALAVQALYQWYVTKYKVDNIIDQFYTHNDFSQVDRAYFAKLVIGVIEQHQELDAIFSAELDRDFEQLTPVECNILRLATWELVNCLEIPFKVIINEAIELAKIFGTADGYKYVNGILNQLKSKIRVRG